MTTAEAFAILRDDDARAGGEMDSIEANPITLSGKFNLDEIQAICCIMTALAELPAKIESPASSLPAK